MRVDFCLSAIALALASASQAQARPPSPDVSVAFGKTIVSTYPDGRRAELWLQPDGAYKAKGRRGDPSSGHWRVKGSKLCLSQSHPMPAPFAYCTPIPSNGMNDEWSAKAVTGEAIRVRLEAGRG